MKLLLVAATAAEIAPLTAFVGEHWHPLSSHTSTHKEKQVTICITGVGMVATTYAVARELQTNGYDLVLQAGVAGSFDRDIPLGSLVRVGTEQYGDLGAEDHDNYLDMIDIGLLPKDDFPFTVGKLVAPGVTGMLAALPVVSGITVNTVSGSVRTITARQARYGATVESMEGAAFFYTCLQEHKQFAQVRAISNYVEPRNRAAWQMKEAIINLNKWLIDFLTQA